MTERPHRLKRPFPTNKVLAWREGYLAGLQNVLPRKPARSVPSGLGLGNTKTGRTGSRFASIFVWNLPAIVTCPAASAWCKRHCYNADSREHVFPVKDWSESWWWALESPVSVSDAINGQLDCAPAPCGVRLHSSGDFFSTEYIELWERIIIAHPDIQFWTYTRSWAVASLKPGLERIRRAPNCHMFASWDAEMPEPPPAWRKALVFDSEESLVQHQARHPESNVCPEQICQVECCASCGICMRKSEEDVLFYLH